MRESTPLIYKFESVVATAMQQQSQSQPKHDGKSRSTRQTAVLVSPVSTPQHGHQHKPRSPASQKHRYLCAPAAAY